uniref:Zgc:193801 n=1 Tax=Cyprinus carpio TaxID=7962 RepID=A0A8C2CW46_CYPCA
LGTEHTYTPVLCQDEKCLGQEKGVHMHCPLCSVAEIYQDPVILRAHFRIKHVDKGIDFAGLKVLRCCVHCEIVGTIKGEKRFKGAHWHCYRCRNGFNRRDEAIKHYKTHFRNPHTTFQIQVTQNVNCRQYYGESSEAHAKAYEGLAVSLGPSGDGFGSILTQPILTTDTETLQTVEPKEDCERNGIPLGAEEEVGSSQNSSDGTQTLVLMDPDGQGNSVIYDTATGILTEQEAESLEQTLLQKRLLELHQQTDTLRQEKESMEKTLRAEIKQLKEQVASLVQSNVRMFEELQAYQCPDHSQQKVAKLLESLEAQHKELLQAQLASLRREILSGADNMPINGHRGALELNVDSEESQTEAISGTLTGLEDMDVQLQTEQHKSTELELVPTDTIPCLESPGLDLDLPNTGLTTSKVLEDKQEVSLSFVSSKKRSSADDSEEMTESKVQRVS